MAYQIFLRACEKYDPLSSLVITDLNNLVFLCESFNPIKLLDILLQLFYSIDSCKNATNMCEEK